MFPTIPSGEKVSPGTGFNREVLNIVRWVGIIEGTSLILLLFIAMPLKYVFDRPEAVAVIGMAHGILWVVYLLVLAVAWIKEKWAFKKVFLGGVASVIPFGPFIYDRKFLSQ